MTDREVGYLSAPLVPGEQMERCSSLEAAAPGAASSLLLWGSLKVLAHAELPLSCFADCPEGP